MPAEPARHTARTPGALTYGPQVGLISRALGEPFMPWQQRAVDVACEMHPTTPGAWRYPVVVVSVPRQSGKSTLLRAVRVHRALLWRHRVILMTAQTGKDARKLWGKMTDRVMARESPLRGHAAVRRSVGTEGLRFDNGSVISPFAPTPKSVHGDTVHLVDVDEAWAFSEDAGTALMDAIEPTQITVPDRQLWIVSTAGTVESRWLKGYIDRARDAASAGAPGIALIEYAAPEGLDPADVDGDDLMHFHPAAGLTQSVDDLLSHRGDPTWRRAYLNLWPAEGTTGWESTEWDACGDADLALPPGGPGRLHIGYAAAADRSAGTITAAWRVPDGRLAVAVLATREGVSWLAPVVIELARTMRPASVSADGAGVTRTVTSEVLDAAPDLAHLHTVLPTADYVTACEHWARAVAERTLTHDARPEIRDAQAVAIRRPMGGGQGYSAAHSLGPIDALQAALLAAYAASRTTTHALQIL